jgi:flagellar biosynthesis GTPase FlhF
MKRPFSKKAMLTLQKDARATELVEIHKRSTRSKKAFAKVYYSHSARGKTSNVAPAAGVLALHKNGLKKVHKLSNADFERICVMIDTNEEPDVGEALRSEYWELHKVYDRALRTEMYLGDQDDLYFEHNLPRDRNTWSGTFVLIGNSGAGKTHWIVQLMMRYMRATRPHSRRTLIYVTPEWTSP